MCPNHGECPSKIRPEEIYSRWLQQWLNFSELWRETVAKRVEVGCRCCEWWQRSGVGVHNFYVSMYKQVQTKPGYVVNSSMLHLEYDIS